MKIEHFSYGPEPEKGIQYHQTSGVSDILTEKTIIRLQTLKPNKDPYLFPHKTAAGKYYSITFVEPTKDYQNRDTKKGHTFLLSQTFMVNYFATKLKPYNGTECEVNV